MPIETWFPLAIYYEDLVDAPKHRDQILQAIQGVMMRSADKRTNETSAWTGDIHNVEKLHRIPAFEWITSQVEYHSLVYLEALGHDVEKLDLYIQRSWPIVSQKGQSVHQHAHYTANLSVVYYVSLASEGSAGDLNFHNEARPNEIGRGLAGSGTNAYKVRNSLNFQQANYSPVEGRIIVFPAKQIHSVDPNQTDTDRISLSYDLVITSREESQPGLHEFLTPPPSEWQRCKRIEAFRAEAN